MIQIFLYFVCNILVAMQLLHHYPYKSRLANMEATLHEALLIFFSYLLLSFTDAFFDHEGRFFVGWVAITVLCLFIAVHFAIALKVTLKKI